MGRPPAREPILFLRPSAKPGKSSKIDHRSLSAQIEHWTRIGTCTEESPELTYELIKEIRKYSAYTVKGWPVPHIRLLGTA